MNVKELIEELSKYPEDNLVLVDGYETGFDNIKSLKLVFVVLENPNNEYVYFDGEYSRGTSDDLIALVLSRNERTIE